MISSKEGYHPARRLTTYKSQECFITTGSSSFTWSCSHVHSTIVRNSVLQFYAIISAYYVFIGELPEEGNGTPLQYSCLENSMDRVAWRAIVHEAEKSRTWLSNTRTMMKGMLIFQAWLWLVHSFNSCGSGIARKVNMQIASQPE